MCVGQICSIAFLFVASDLLTYIGCKYTVLLGITKIFLSKKVVFNSI